MPIEVEIPSHQLLLKVGQEPGERWDGRMLDLHKLEASREEAMSYYNNQATKKRNKFNKYLKDKDLKRGMLVLRYDNR